MPGRNFLRRERFSHLTYSGSKKISRMPARSAIVGFSVENVYAIAELIRRQKGGAAVVMGALSPRTRNAQVAMYQNGDVDYLVATDAIGMGLNLDVDHVAFSGLSKFDGRRMRRSQPNELAQIAGRAGRHMNDGTFGVTGEAPPLDEEVVEAIDQHRFTPLRAAVAQRRARLRVGDRLIASLEAPRRRSAGARARGRRPLALQALAQVPEGARPRRPARGAPVVGCLPGARFPRHQPCRTRLAARGDLRVPASGRTGARRLAGHIQRIDRTTATSTRCRSGWPISGPGPMSRSAGLDGDESHWRERRAR
jgi:ATP-dependent RNA helicase SUPV3L1/SUV3